MQTTRKRFISFLTILFIALVSQSAHAGDFIDTRLTFSLSNQNLMVEPGETNPSNPGTRFAGDDVNKLFFENYNTKDSGFESLSHLVLYKKADGFIEGIQTEGGFVVRFQILDEENMSINDAGSYIKLRYSWMDDKADQDDFNLSLTGFPLSSDRFRLGYSYRISWGGSDVFKANSTRNLTPGAKLQFQLPGIYAFLGMKTSQMLHQDINEEVTNYGGLAGFGIDIIEELRLDLGGGYFERGVNPKLEVLGDPFDAFGGSVQLTYHDGMPVGTSIDFKLYKNDPLEETVFFKKPEYKGGASWLVAGEFSMLYQSLQDPAILHSTILQNAYAGDLNFIFGYDYLRLHLDTAVQTLSFILFNVPSFTPFVDFPESSEFSPELFVAGGADYHFPSVPITAGLSGGVQFPAWYRGDVNAGNNPPSSLEGVRTQVVRSEGDLTILPENEDPTPIIAAKVFSQWFISDFLTAVAEVNFALDNNETRLEDNDEGIAIRRFVDPYRLGFNILLQARF